jgi:hypothetical protein
MELDSQGKEATWKHGTRVYVYWNKLYATVIEQKLCYDCGECFWGNVTLMYDDGAQGISNSWQLERVDK